MLLTCVAMLVPQLLTTHAFASASKSKSDTPVSTLAQLDKVLAKSIKLESLPTDLVPSLTQLANSNAVQGSSYLHHLQRLPQSNEVGNYRPHQRTGCLHI